MANLEVLILGEGHDRNEPIMVGSSDDEEDNIEHRRLRRLGGHHGTPIPRRRASRIFSPPPAVPGLPLNIMQALPFLEEINQVELMRMFLAERQIPRPIARIPQPAPDPEPYDVRMTHASARPRLGFSYDFEQPEQVETPIPRRVKYKQTIEIPDSPKGKSKEHKEIIEIYSDDEEVMASSSQPVPVTKLTSVLICAGCRRPLRTGGDRLWALRCGHMIDSRCYTALSRPEFSSLSLLDRLDPPKRRKTGKDKAKGKGKGVMESHEWTCPVKDCAKVHKSERMAGEEDWVPAHDSGAIKVFI